MRRLLVWLVAVGVLAVSSIAAAGTVQGLKVTVFGDSVADKMQRSPVALAALNDGFTLDLQTRGCRRLVSPSCTIVGSSGTPTSVLPLVKSLGPRIGKIVVVAVGYNDTPTHYDHDLDAVMRALQDQGVKTVVWLTLRDPHHVYQASNKDIKAEPKEWPQLVIADWDRYSENHPDWFYNDGIHLTPLGAGELGQFIHSALRRSAGHS
jgi:lysophospholipase L1-like esterase